MHAFEDAVLSSGPASAAAIIAYVRSINRAQAEELVDIARASPDREVRDLTAAYCSSFGELRLVRALTDDQIAAMRDPRLVGSVKLPVIEDAMKADGFLAGRPRTASTR